MVDIYTLVTPRLRLRPWRDDDLAPFARINGDPVVMKHFVAPLDRAASDELVERQRGRFGRGEFGFWATVLADDDTLIGCVGLAASNLPVPFAPYVEIGWRLGKEWWGRGYAPEAAHAALLYAFEVRGVDEVVAMTTPKNTPSRRVMEKLGMSYSPADDFDHPSLPEEHPLRRHVLYRLAKDDWKRNV